MQVTLAVDMARAYGRTKPGTAKFSDTALLIGSCSPEAHEGKTKSWREVVSELTGRCSNAHANGGTHAGGAALSGAVDPIRIPVVATEHPLGQ